MSQLEQSPQARALSALRYLSEMSSSHHKKYIDPDSITAWNGDLRRKSPVKQKKITIRIQNQKLPLLRTNIRSNTNVTMISSIKNHRKTNNSRSFIDCGKVQGLGSLQGSEQPTILQMLKISPQRSQLSFPPEQLKPNIVQAEQKLFLTPLPTKTFGFKAIPLHQQMCHREAIIFSVNEGNQNITFRQNPKILSSQRSANIMGVSQQNFDVSRKNSCKQMNKKQSQKENLKIHYF